MRSIIPKILRSKRNDRGISDEEVSEADDSDNNCNNNNIAARRKAFAESPPVMKRSFSASQGSSDNAGTEVRNFDRVMAAMTEYEDYRIFVATWNVGGKTPDNGLNLEDFLKVEGSSDIYVFGFQEIVPLNAGNVLVIEDNEPAAKWLGLISRALNKSVHDSSSTCASGDSSPTSRSSGLNYSNKLKETRSPTHLAFFQKPSLKVLSRSLRVDSSLLKSCNCSLDDIAKTQNKQRPKVFSGPLCVERTRFVEETPPSSPCSSNHLRYGLVASKQMVGVFLSVWARTELVQHIAHLRVATIGTGFMGCLGNKGCISVSLSLHQTSFCFVCSHLASGEKEGDELKRNADVAEILKNIQFQKICRNPISRAPERIIGHDRIIWLGDFNYRIALSYEETKAHLEDNDWKRLLEKDQLNIEKEAGRVFNGWKEGKILFAPTYKYTQNSDSYAGETVKSKKKRRTPAWCDRILWHGHGIDQVAYIRGESRFSDHRPVCSVFTVKVESRGSIKPTRRYRKGYSSCAGGTIVEFEGCVHQSDSWYEF